MTWTAAVGGESCGGCDLPFKTNEPMALLTAKLLKRCALCVSPAPIDYAAVDAVLAAREAERAAQTASESTVFKGGAPVLTGFVPAAEATDRGTSQRLPPVRPPLPFAKVADVPDPKAAAFND